MTKCCCCKPIHISENYYQDPHADYQLESGLLKAGVLVFDSKGRILLQQSYGNKWGLSKGAVQDLRPIVETPRSAAVRELEEETGLDLCKDDLTLLTGFSIHKTDYIFFQARIDETESTITPGKESTAVTWVCPNCYFEKLSDQSGMKGMQAVNWASRLVLENLKIDFVDHAVTNLWGNVLFHGCKKKHQSRCKRRRDIKKMKVNP